MTPAKIVDIRSARSKQQPTSVHGLEVTEGTASDWLEATIGPRGDVPHSRGEKVIALRAAPPKWWALVHFGMQA